MTLFALAAVFFAMNVLRVALVYRRTGVNPVLLRPDDSLMGVLQRALLAAFAGVLVTAVVYGFAPGLKTWLGPISYLETPAVHAAGAVLAGAAIGWIGVAQAQMSASFRIGLDPAEKTALIRRGLYSVSRHPIYLGIRTAAIGFFLMAPNAVTVGLTVAAFIGFAIVARLEEEHLLRTHGDAYRDYCTAVRRWL